MKRVAVSGMTTGKSWGGMGTDTALPGTGRELLRAMNRHPVDGPVDEYGRKSC